MRMTGRHREARILARIEAELGESDPRLLALFDGLEQAGPGQRPHRRAARARWARLLAALVPVLALVLAATLSGGHRAGWQGCPAALGCPGITSIADRAVATVQAHTADWGREINAQLCRAIPVAEATGCG